MAKVARRLSPAIFERLRREFFPRDFAPARRALIEWDVKRDAWGATAARMDTAVLTLARRELAGLRLAIQRAKEDFRDVLMWTETSRGKPRRARGILCTPEPGPLNPEEEAFLAALLENPTDNLTRLVYADWLDERDDPRGPYLRVLVDWLTSRKLVDEDLFAREEELRVGLSQAWLARIRGMPVRYGKAK